MLTRTINYKIISISVNSDSTWNISMNAYQSDASVPILSNGSVYLNGVTAEELAALKALIPESTPDLCGAIISLPLTFQAYVPA